MPKIPQRKFNAPQSVRGIKSIDLGSAPSMKKANHLEVPKDRKSDNILKHKDKN
jgi:hypothetical protein